MTPTGPTQDAPSTNLPQLRKNKLGARKETTSGKTNKNLNNAERTKLTYDALPQTKPPKRNKPTTETSPDKSAAIYPATTTNALRNTYHPNLNNRQDRTTTEAAQTRTSKRRPSIQWAKGQAGVGGPTCINNCHPCRYTSTSRHPHTEAPARPWTSTPGYRDANAPQCQGPKNRASDQ